MGFDFVRPFVQAGISDERLPAGLRQIPLPKLISTAFTLQKIGTTAV
jgi:hypothetical protein